ncbi:cyclodeaminase/cyclohydrolase family protein [Aureibaculum luteum]|uniref:cyclodeaminase/cyclohydrolase family protein n=1 Tax=Aureibaculum luteum TaxID=1548456 RepID=UPI000E4CD2AE|nr:cyclodeaminase/cyclohydrolase family protein [Aureibaculum luteum]
MNINLLEITTDELLEKFGAGKHKPGSGSAAALQGMLSAKLLTTVISLTNVTKRQTRYKKALPKLLEMDAKIQNHIFPELTRLFQEDAVQFDKAITARIERDNEKDVIKSNLLSIKALTELKLSIDIPIEITKLCIELADISDFVFDNAFKGARGDSQVALSGAVAGIAGCLSIIQLNLLSFGSDEYAWTSKILIETKKLRSKFDKLSEIANSKIKSLEDEVFAISTLYREVEQLLNSLKSKSKLTDKNIENGASKLQNLLWSYKDVIWINNVPNHPAKVLRPNLVLKKALAYNYFPVETLEIIDDDYGSFEVAGIINQKDKIVLISNNFDKNTQNFTAAHELGHALLHKQTILHRDRPINGISQNIKRNFTERQADKFATYFLMPAKLVKKEFYDLFSTEKFIINEQTSFNLIKDSPSKLRNECKNLRGLSLKLASSERFDNQSFISISNLFNVSTMAMAIRLEELSLIEF